MVFNIVNDLRNKSLVRHFYVLAIILVFVAFWGFFVAFCSVCSSLTVDGALEPTCPVLLAVST